MPVCRKWINRKLAGNIICLRNLEQKAVFRNSINFIEQLSVSLSCLNTRLGKAYCDYLITAMVNIYFAFINKRKSCRSFLCWRSTSQSTSTEVIICKTKQMFSHRLPICTACSRRKSPIWAFHKQPIYKPTNGYFVVNEYNKHSMSEKGIRVWGHKWVQLFWGSYYF